MDHAQEAVARIALAAAIDHGFVLAGGHAIALHGIGHRLTEDVDLFTNVTDVDNFRCGVDAVAAALRSADWQCEVETAGDTFARITATHAGQSVAVDMGLDYRAEPPAILEVGPVLSLADAAGSKMATLYSRGLPRDFLDVDALVTSGRFSRESLLELADHIEAEPLDRVMLADRFRLAQRTADREFTGYGLTGLEVERLRSRFASWADSLSVETSRGQRPDSS